MGFARNVLRPRRSFRTRVHRSYYASCRRRIAGLRNIHHGPSADAWNMADNPQQRKKYVEAFKRSSIKTMLNYYKANFPRKPYTEEGPKLPKIKCSLLMFLGLDASRTTFAPPSTSRIYSAKAASSRGLLCPDSEGVFIKAILFRYPIGPRSVFPKNKVTIEAGTCRTICPNTYRLDKKLLKTNLKRRKTQLAFPRAGPRPHGPLLVGRGNAAVAFALRDPAAKIARLLCLCRVNWIPSCLDIHSS